MIAETITGFASHLADEGFVISPERIGECLSVFTEEGIDCTEFNDVVSVMKLFFCSTKEESRALPELFEEYIRFSPIVKMKEQMDIEKAHQEKTGDQEKHEAKMTGLNAKKKELEEERERIETEIYQESFSKLEQERPEVPGGKRRMDSVYGQRRNTGYHQRALRFLKRHQ